MGKLIVFEGTDGSGKSTQFSLLTRRLEARGVDFRTMVFPQYTEPSSALIRMYLGGEFGARPSDVNAYTASTFYAVDRFAAFRKVWGEYYRNGGLMLSDRPRRSRSRTARGFLRGSMISSTAIWACPCRTSCCISTCRRS